nr:unnamed protein product [Callosobruchus analis]
MDENIDVNTLGGKLTTFFAGNIRTIFPLTPAKESGSRQLVNWFTHDLKNITHSNCPQYKELHKSLLKRYKEEIDKAKKQPYDSLMLNTKNKAKVAWKIINTETNRNNKSINESLLSADEMNSFFVDVRSRKRPFDLSCVPLESSRTFFFGPVDEQEVFNAFFSLNNSPSADIFDINLKIPASTIDLMLVSLTLLINKTFLTGISDVQPSKIKRNKLTPDQKVVQSELRSLRKAIQTTK